MSDKKDNSSNSQMYDRMVGHLGDFMSKVMEEEGVEENKSLYRNLESISSRYGSGRLIASGGMKEIYEVEDQKTGRPVAMAIIKQLKSKELIEQFIQEARITAGLEHPNIMPVYDIGIESSGQAYFTMKLVTADNLGNIIKNLRKQNKEYLEKYPLNRLLEIFCDICDAVAFAHSKGVLHLDLKPDNIQVGDFGEVLVCDWGLSRFRPDLVKEEGTSVNYVNGQLTMHGQVFGSPGYMSPEQASSGRETLDHRSDIYSLGCLLYSFLTYQPPFKSDSVEGIIKDTAKGYFTRPAEFSKGKTVPEALDAVCCHSMEYEQEDRYQSALDLKNDIRSFLNGYATFAQQASIVTQVVLYCRRQKALVASLTAAVLFAVISSYVYLTAETEKEQAVKQLDQKEEENKKVVEKLDESTARNEQLLASFTKIRKRLNMVDNFNIIQGLNNLENRKFSKAAIDLKSANDEAFAPYIKICEQLGEEYESKALPRPLLYDLVTYLNKDLYTAVIQRFLRKEAEFIPENELQPLTQDLLNITNPQCNSVNFTYQSVFGRTYISLGRNEKLENIAPLVLMKAQYLDLSGSSVSDISPLLGMPLVSLNLRNTLVNDLEALIDSPITSLDLSFTKIKTIESLLELPISQLKVSGLKLNFENILPKLKNLTELYVLSSDRAPSNLPDGCVIVQEK
ncbi:MAG: protein kinase [Lentisphaeraceae bacterium]|nr:protein kinase [Lentisphaeraceae bacterium]